MPNDIRNAFTRNTAARTAARVEQSKMWVTAPGRKPGLIRWFLDEGFCVSLRAIHNPADVLELKNGNLAQLKQQILDECPGAVLSSTSGIETPVEAARKAKDAERQVRLDEQARQRQIEETERLRKELTAEIPEGEKERLRLEIEEKFRLQVNVQQTKAGRETLPANFFWASDEFNRKQLRAWFDAHRIAIANIQEHYDAFNELQRGGHLKFVLNRPLKRSEQMHDARPYQAPEPKQYTLEKCDLLQQRLLQTYGVGATITEEKAIAAGLSKEDFQAVRNMHRELRKDERFGEVKKMVRGNFHHPRPGDPVYGKI